jgi:hypothetical protein
MHRDFKELDLVRIKSTGVIGVIVNITRAGTFDVEKWGNEGPVYFNILREDMEHVGKSQYWKKALRKNNENESE